MNGNRWIAVGAAMGALMVVLGAFGAHALKERFDAQELDWWRTAVQYHAWHALALVLFGLTRQRRPGAALPGWLFLLGIVLFCGTVYGLALGAPRWFGAITPIGGAAWILGWIAFAWTALREKAD